MGEVFSLTWAETVQLDQARLGMLYRKLGEDGAESVLDRASRELSGRVARCERCWALGDLSGLRKSARSIIAIADQAGMPALARVARDVTAAADQRDIPALAATLARLRRVGDGSLQAAGRLRGAMV